MTLSKAEKCLVGITEATGVYPPGVDPMDERFSLEYLEALQLAMNAFNTKQNQALSKKIDQTNVWLSGKR